MRVFLDMDGVLADFIGGACVEHGWHYQDVLDHWQPGVWDDITRLVADGDSDLFWQPILGAQEGFWRWLEPCPWFFRMVDLARRVDHSWSVATMTGCPFSAAGKVLWLNSHLGPGFDRYYLCRTNKAELAGPGKLLIDDKDENVQAWREAGGKAVLFPAVWNSNHRIWQDGEEIVLDYVSEAVNNITGGKVYGGV